MLSAFPIVRTHEIRLPRHNKGAGGPKAGDAKGDLWFTVRETFHLLWAEFCMETLCTAGARVLTCGRREYAGTAPGWFVEAPGIITRQRHVLGSGRERAQCPKGVYQL